MALSQFQINSESDKSEPLKRQRSLRRVVPLSNSNGEPVPGISAKMIERPRSNIVNSTSCPTYSHYFQEYSLIAEYNMLVSHGLPGLYVIPAANSAIVWFCVVFVRKGLYQGGIFRFNLLIPEDFPNCVSSPRVVFESKVFHPSVDPVTGDMELKSVFPTWKKDVDRLWQVLDHVLRMFCSVDTKNSFNLEAAELFETSQEEFIKRVNECVSLSQTTIYDDPSIDDPHYLKFDQYKKETHDKSFNALTEHKDAVSRIKARGLSWVQYGSLEPFSASNS